MTKTFLLLFSIFLFTKGALFAQQTDLSAIRDLSAFMAFRKKAGDLQDNFETIYSWNGVKARYTRCSGNNLQFTVDAAAPFEAKKLLTYLEKTYGATLSFDEDYSKTTYTVNTKGFSLSAEISKTRKEAFAENTAAYVVITFKKNFTQPLPNLPFTQARKPDGIFYYVKTNCYNNSFTIKVNGIIAAVHTGKDRYVEKHDYILNGYLLQPGQAEIGITITPGLDAQGNARPAIIKNSYFEAFLCSGKLVNGELTEEDRKTICQYHEYVTDTIREDGDIRYSSYPGTYQHGKPFLKNDYTFTAGIPYNLSGWKNGKDLRKEPQLKEKIIVAYERLAQAFKNQDEQLLNDLLYQAHAESITAGYGILWNDADKQWASWTDLFGHAFSFKVATDFTISFSDDGKLISTTPEQQQDMLRVVGKGQAAGFTYALYMDAASGELKFIRNEN